VKGKIWFAVAGAMMGAAIACIQIGVSEMMGEKADESWAKVTVPDAEAKS
jgi:hypothetical protein